MEQRNRCVVRNQAYRKSGIGIRERHNERRNQGYANADIIAERSPLNAHFKRCEGSYTEVFDRMVESGAISTRGLKPDAKIMDEMVFDVNTAYFDRGGGYEFAKQFFTEAYRLAIKEAGGEEYILSAVMHADERNRALSEEQGRDIFHYHLHVVYVPVVEKAVKWTKRCKDPALVGTVKETIHQVSHSKKWASEMALDENGLAIRDANGRAVLVNAYSLLQDRFFAHMREAGYQDIQRGERGSTAEHLDTLEYKIQRDTERLAALESAVQDKQEQAAALDKTMKQKEKRLSSLQERLAASQNANQMVQQLDGMGKQKLLGKRELQPEEWKQLLTLAKEGLASRDTVRALREQLAAATKDKGIYKERWESLRSRTKDYLDVEALHPEQTRTAMETLKRLTQEPPTPPMRHKRGLTH